MALRRVKKPPKGKKIPKVLPRRKPWKLLEFPPLVVKGLKKRNLKKRLAPVLLTRRGGALKRKPRKKKVKRKGGGWKKTLGIIGGLGAAGLAASAYTLKDVGKGSRLSSIAGRKYAKKY